MLRPGCILWCLVPIRVTPVNLNKICLKIIVWKTITVYNEATFDISLGQLMRFFSFHIWLTSNRQTHSFVCLLHSIVKGHLCVVGTEQHFTGIIELLATSPYIACNMQYFVASECVVQSIPWINSHSRFMLQFALQYTMMYQKMNQSYYLYWFQLLYREYIHLAPINVFIFNGRSAKTNSAAPSNYLEVCIYYL